MFELVTAAVKKIAAMEIAQFLHMIDEERERLALASQSERPRMEGGPAGFIGDLDKGDTYAREDEITARPFEMGFTRANRNDAERT